MPVNVYDQAGRYLVKQDSQTFLAWGLELAADAFRFRGWLDTRLLPFPGQGDRTCDTVAQPRHWGQSPAAAGLAASSKTNRLPGRTFMSIS